MIIDTRLPSKTMSFCGSEVFRFLPAANPHFVPAARQPNVIVGGRLSGPMPATMINPRLPSLLNSKMPWDLLPAYGERSIGLAGPTHIWPVGA